MLPRPAGTRTDRLLEIVAALILVAVGALSIRRLGYGVHFSDESFYAAVTQRFALGDRPYVDEANLRQTASFLTVPFYWAYLKVRGSTDGIMYFLRLVYFGLQLAVGGALFKLAVGRVHRAFAIVAAAAPLTFVPFGMPTCSYNTLGSLLFALGSLLGLRRLLEPGPARTLVAAGVAHGLAFVAYPPLAVPVALFTAATHVAVPAERRTGRWRPLYAYGAGLVGLGLCVAVPLVPFVVQGLSDALRFEGMLTRPRTMDKVEGILRAVRNLLPGGAVGVGVAVGAGLLTWFARPLRPLRGLLLGALVAAIALWFARMRPAFAPWVPAHTVSLHTSIYVGLLGGLFLLLVPRVAGGRALFLAGYLPSIVAGFITAVASDNVACMNMGLGTFTAALLALVAAPLASEASAPEPSAGSSAGVRAMAGVSRLALLAALASVPASMLANNYDATYWDGPISVHTKRVNAGPFLGLRTMPAKAAWAEEITREVRAVAKPGERMLAFYDFPAGYLIAPSKPGLPTSWTDRRARLVEMLPYYQKHRTGNGLVLAYMLGRDGGSPQLEALCEHPSRLLKDGGWYRIYREPPP